MRSDFLFAAITLVTYCTQFSRRRSFSQFFGKVNQYSAALSVEAPLSHARNE